MQAKYMLSAAETECVVARSSPAHILTAAARAFIQMPDGYTLADMAGSEAPNGGNSDAAPP